MSAIAGIWNLDGRPLERDLTHLGSPLPAGQYEADARWSDGAVGLLCRSVVPAPDAPVCTQPLVHASAAVVAFDGRLDNRDELLAALGPTADLSHEASDAAFVLAAYARFGDAFPERLLGDFALAVFDPSRRQLLLARDVMGIRALHFWLSPRTFLFASTIRSLLAHPAVTVRPNDAVVARYVTHRWIHEDLCSTCFDGIATLPPAHLAIVTPDRFITRQYWDFDPSRRVRLRSMDEYAEAFRHYFNQAVTRRLRSTHPVAVALSGGLDSSAVYGAAETQRRADPAHRPPLMALSYVYADGSLADETAYLRDIEQEFGITVERLPAAATAATPLDDLGRQLREVETPLLSAHWPSFAPLLDHAYRRGSRVLLTGQSGDQVLVNEAYLVDLVRRFRWYRAWSDVREIPRWLTDAEPGVFTRELLRSLVKFHAPVPALDAYRRLRAATGRYTGVPAWYTTAFRAHALTAGRTSTERRFSSAYATSLHAYLRSPTSAVSNEWYAKVSEAHGLDQRAPFLDRDLVAFLLAIPGEMQTWQGVPKALLRRAMRSELPETVAGRRWKGDFTQQVNDGGNRLVPALIESLRSGGLVGEFGYVDRQKALEVLARWPQTRSETLDTFPVWQLIGLELWLRVFFGDRTAQSDRRDAAAVAAS